jgi:membrane protein YqaA with SNARE-associated domain
MQSISRIFIGLFASPLGVVVLAALDSTLFFSLPFGIDAIVIILAARLGSTAWIVPLLATAGSVGGAAVTFWMGVKIGEQGLERYVSPNRLKRVHARVKNSSAIALAALDLIPPPFPFTPFVLAAGALEVPLNTFFVTLAACRILRFSIEAALAVIYGRSIVSWLDSAIFRDVVLFLIVLAIVGTVISIVTLVRSTKPPTHHAAAA